uniref:Uncharacterized protein n=1 Tax=Calcidiscus leptoporus TaxID=127549 RepID=A0A7S0JCR0_9EUKA|mmetsp:Transcript_51704/g.118781  ORF Transcript_51704/g.118781 Transcript_51704/m.118781 type:complete len:413 (+) Transcript_51704:73-1311(+)
MPRLHWPERSSTSPLTALNVGERADVPLPASPLPPPIFGEAQLPCSSPHQAALEQTAVTLAHDEVPSDTLPLAAPGGMHHVAAELVSVKVHQVYGSGGSLAARFHSLEIAAEVGLKCQQIWSHPVLARSQARVRGRLLRRSFAFAVDGLHALVVRLHEKRAAIELQAKQPHGFTGVDARAEAALSREPLPIKPDLGDRRASPSLEVVEACSRAKGAAIKALGVALVDGAVSFAKAAEEEAAADEVSGVGAERVPTDTHPTDVTSDVASTVCSPGGSVIGASGDEGAVLSQAEPTRSAGELAATTAVSVVVDLREACDPSSSRSSPERRPRAVRALSEAHPGVRGRSGPQPLVQALSDEADRSPCQDSSGHRLSMELEVDGISVIEPRRSRKRPFVPRGFVELAKSTAKRKAC